MISDWLSVECTHSVISFKLFVIDQKLRIQTREKNAKSKINSKCNMYM
jgi:hypothetical protein